MTATKTTMKRKKGSPVTSILLGLAVGGLCGWAGMQVGKGFAKAAQGTEASGLPFWLPLLFVIVACFGGLFLHELGHLLAGLRVGFTPYLFAVGPLRVERDERGKYRAKWNREIALWGGAAASLPPAERRTKIELLRDFAFIVAAGPLMSLSIAALSLSVRQLLPESWEGLRLFLLLMGGMSAGYFVITAIPMANGDFLTDGARFLQLHRGGPAAERDAALLQLYSLMNAGTPARDWSDDLINDALTPDDDSVSAAAGNFFAYVRAIDRSEIPAATIYLEKAKDAARTSQKPAFAVEAAYFAAWHEKKVAAAEALLAEAGARPLGVSEADLLRTKAAIALRRGEIAEGKILLDRADAALADSRAVAWTRSRLTEMRAAFLAR